MEIEGKLQINLYRDGNRVRDVEIHSSRPLQATRIFHGKTIPELLQTMPLLYHVCGMAQASAAVTACEQAMSIRPYEASMHAREMLVWMETAREHCWRILIDWTDKLGDEKNKTAIVQLQQLLPELKKALFSDGDGFYPGAQVAVNTGAVQSIIQRLKHLLEEIVYSMPVEQWSGYADWYTFEQWLLSEDTVVAKILRQLAKMDELGSLNASVSFLPMLDDASLHQRLLQADADHFIAQPQWQGEPCETTVLCRQQQHSLVAAMFNINGNGAMMRMVARLVELANIPAILERLLRQIVSSQQQKHSSTSKQDTEDTGVGLAQIEAARGRLVHRLELQQGIVRQYQILAPTEWNFHPRGIAAQLLKTLPVKDESTLKQQVDLLISIIDPCVRYETAVH